MDDWGRSFLRLIRVDTELSELFFKIFINFFGSFAHDLSLTFLFAGYFLHSLKSWFDHGCVQLLTKIAFDRFIGSRKFILSLLPRRFFLNNTWLLHFQFIFLPARCLALNNFLMFNDFIKGLFRYRLWFLNIRRLRLYFRTWHLHFICRWIHLCQSPFSV